MTRISDEEMERIKAECARMMTPAWQYDAGWNSANIDAFLGVRDDDKLNDPEITESWKEGYMDYWNAHKKRMAMALRGNHADR